MTSRIFFFLKPSLWNKNSSGSSDSSATASAAVSSSLSGWYSHVSGRGWEKLTSIVRLVATFLGNTNGADKEKHRNGSRSRGPTLSSAYPFSFDGRCSAASLPITSRESSAVSARNATRNAMLLLALLSDDKSRRWPPSVKNTLQPRPS